MAKGTDNSGDWTAGIVAMVAALLLGGGIPVGLYYGLYQPKVEELVGAEQELKEVENRLQLLNARAIRVKALEDEGDEMGTRVAELEKDFVIEGPGEEGEVSLSEALVDIEDLATIHHLAPRQESGRRQVSIVAPAGGAIEFKDGLKASRFVVEVRARYHDFGRFLAAMESREKYTIIPEDLLCQGDATRGTRHTFVLHFYIIQKRDLNAIGT